MAKKQTAGEKFQDDLKACDWEARIDKIVSKFVPEARATEAHYAIDKLLKDTIDAYRRELKSVVGLS